MKRVLSIFFIFTIVISSSVFGNIRTERIVAGTVAIAQMLDVLEVESVVGVPATTYELPKRYSNLPKIGNPMNPSIESVKALRPTLFITSASLKNSLQSVLSQNKIPTIFLELNTMDQLKTTILSLGKLLGKSQKANELYNEIVRREKEVLRGISGKERPKVLIIFGAPGNFMIATEASYVGSMAKKLGAINVVHNSSQAYIPLNMELIISTQPDYILRLTHADPVTSKKMFEKEFSENKLWSHFKAVREGKVIDLPSGYFGVNANILFLEAFEMLAKFLYGV